VGLVQKGLVSSLHQMLGQNLGRVGWFGSIFGGFCGVQCTRNVGFSWWKNHSSEGGGDGDGGGCCYLRKLKMEELWKWLKRRRERERRGARGWWTCSMWLKTERSSFVKQRETGEWGRKKSDGFVKVMGKRSVWGIGKWRVLMESKRHMRKKRVGPEWINLGFVYLVSNHISSSKESWSLYVKELGWWWGLWEEWVH